MKFSVLLPTRNRLDLLSYAIETVRRQDYLDWEIIVFDNASEEDIPGYVRSLNDSRIKCYRTEKLVPVTDNWNNALSKSNGDYVIMLGDDDCLMEGYFSTLNKVIEEYEAPDLIYTSAFLYAYPGVMPGFPEGYLRSYMSSEIFQSAKEPFWLEKSKSMALVNHSIDFRIRFDYNMQFSLVSRKLIQRLEKYGSFYQSPYPDYYATNAAMLKAESILIVPKPLVTIGISPKSFGFYYFNDLEEKGNKFLQNIPDPDMAIRLQQVILPGTDMNTSWLLSMETLRQNFAKDGIVKVNYERYRLLQIYAVYARSLLERYKVREDMQNLKRKMNLREWIFYGIPLSVLIAICVIFVPKRYYASISRRITRSTGSHPRSTVKRRPSMIKGNFNTVIDVFEKVKPVSDSVNRQSV